LKVALNIILQTNKPRSINEVLKTILPFLRDWIFLSYIANVLGFVKLFNGKLFSWQKFSYYNCRLFFLLSQDYVMWLQSTTAGTRMYIDETDTNKVPYSFPLNNFTNPNTFAIYDKNSIIIVACCVFLRLVYHMLSLSLDCPF
jgi:hypothetical protein